MLAAVLFLSLCSAVISATDLPVGIKKCKDDDKLNECILKQSKGAIAALVKGDPKAGLPVLDPMFIPKIDQSQGGTRSISMNLTQENIHVIGLANAEIVKSEVDTTKKIFRLIVKIDELNIVSDYILRGKFLVLPVTGKGNSTITLYDTTYVFSIEFKVEKKKGVDHISFIPPPKLTYTPGKMALNFENLFNGDKTLGENVNKLMNDNWKEFNNQLGPGIAQGIAEMFNLVLNRVTGTIPYKELFL